MPARWFGNGKGNFFEKLSFALALYPFLRWGYYIIVHYNEIVMGSGLICTVKWNILNRESKG
jgi:hypothetical protein